MPKKRIVRKNNVKCNDRIEVGMAHFKARFGNLEDIEIIRQYGELKKIIAEIDDVLFRKLELELIEKNMTSKMKDIRDKEKSLWRNIKNRNV